MCISCSTEHPVFDSKKPAILICSDQNFVPIWPGTNEYCAAVCRVENPTLHELIDLVDEILAGQCLPDGSIFLIGNVSYLHRVGLGLFAVEWNQVVSRVERGWPGVRLCPLIPLLGTDVPGSVNRDILEVAAWYAKVYEGSILGLNDCWTKVSKISMQNSAGVTFLTNIESYTVSAPGNLDVHTVLVPWTFYTNSSRPSLLKGNDQGQSNELLDAIAGSIVKDFHIHFGVGVTPENTVQPAAVKEPFTRIVLVGASILKRCAVHLRSKGYDVLDMCTPGWMATPATVAELCQKLKTLQLGPGTAIVFDLFGNSVTRYKLYDGSTSLPTRGGGAFTCSGRFRPARKTSFRS
jgi:hypothetical protein